MITIPRFHKNKVFFRKGENASAEGVCVCVSVFVVLRRRRGKKEKKLMWLKEKHKGKKQGIMSNATKVDNNYHGKNFPNFTFFQFHHFIFQNFMES